MRSLLPRHQARVSATFCSCHAFRVARPRCLSTLHHSIPGHATRRGTAGFFARDHDLNDPGHPTHTANPLLTHVVAKAGWEVNALSFGFPRHPRLMTGAVESSLLAAVTIARQNFLQVYSPTAPEATLSSCRALHTLLLDRKLAHREELVTWGTLNRGHALDPASLVQELDRVLAATGLETLDLGMIRVDLRDPRTPRGKALLEGLQRVMECLDALGSSAASPNKKLQYYGLDLRLPFYLQPKDGRHQEGEEEGEPLTRAQEEEMVLPSTLEEAALVEGSRLAVLSYPMHITNKHLVTLPLMTPDEEEIEEGGGGEGPDRTRRRRRSSAHHQRPLSRLATGALVGHTGDGQAIELSSHLLPPALTQRLHATLDQLSPVLRTSPLLEAKILRCVLAAEVDLIQLSVEDQVGLLQAFLAATGGGGLRRQDRGLQWAECEAVWKEFCLLLPPPAPSP